MKFIYLDLSDLKFGHLILKYLRIEKAIKIQKKKMARSGLLAIAVIAVVMAVSFQEGT